MLKVGDRVPAARVHLSPGEETTIARLHEDGPVLLVFYLFVWSSTRTDELERLRDRRREFDDAGVRVFGISRDSPWTHIAWAQTLDLNFPLVSDWNAEAVHAFGIPFEFRGLKDVAQRTAFIVDQSGTVRGAWSYDTSEVPDFDELLRAAQALSA
jgi:peroxiredoxin